MAGQIVEILDVKKITHNVKSFNVKKPKNFSFVPGQAVDMSINLPSYEKEKRPFTITSLNWDKNLEFTIKIYPERKGITEKLGKLKKGEELIIYDLFGAISYKGKGVCIAGGAGVTPFIAILRQLRKDKELDGNTLIFSNKTEEDIILKSEFDKMAKGGLKVIYTLTRELNPKYANRRIDESFIKGQIKDFKHNFYVCGSIRFVGEIVHSLRKLGADDERII